MTSSIRKSMPTPLEMEYRERVKQATRDSRTVTNGKSTIPGGASHLTEDIVNLSSVQSDAGSSTKLKPSLSVTAAEKKALQSQFSVYA